MASLVAVNSDKTRYALHVKRVPVVAMIAQRGDRFLLARRRDGGPRDGHWEFPGGKVEQGETPEEALKREIAEELGIEIITGSREATVDWDYPDVSIRLIGIAAAVSDPYQTEGVSGEGDRAADR